MKTVVSIGEALIDFIPEKKGCGLKDNAVFERVCGGAPANVVAAVSLLGGSGRMVTQLGTDGFGDHIVEVLQNVGVKTDSILRTDKANTSLAFVALKEDGNREFSFYRKPGADMLLEDADLKKEWFTDCGALHFCSVDLIDCPMKEAHRKAIELAKEQGAIISFDPNIRLPLWDDHEKLKQTVREFIGFADVLKISDEELEFITGKSDIHNAAPELFSKGVQMILFSEGAGGARVLTPEYEVQAPSVKVAVSDTTGAGDAVIGAFLYGLTERNITCVSDITKETAQKMLTFANAYAAYSVMGKGAIAAYGTKEQVLSFMEERGL
ncbi:MAG: carbohydrate kinase [Clostridia bacterium]|nr:carbohydrate kinase [Clostridia bacterium]